MLHPFGTFTSPSIRFDEYQFMTAIVSGFRASFVSTLFPYAALTFMVFGSPADALGCVLSAIGGRSVVSEPLIARWSSATDHACDPHPANRVL